MVSVSIAGAAGYAGGELARLLVAHPDVELAQVTSATRAGTPLHALHPNMTVHAFRPFA